MSVKFKLDPETNFSALVMFLIMLIVMGAYERLDIADANMNTLYGLTIAVALYVLVRSVRITRP